MEDVSFVKAAGNVAFIPPFGRSKHRGAVELPTYIGKTGEFLSMGSPYTLEISTKAMARMVDETRYYLYLISSTLSLKTIIDAARGHSISLSGEAKQLDEILAKFGRRLEHSFAISSSSESHRGSLDYLVDRHIRKDKRYRPLAGS